MLKAQEDGGRGVDLDLWLVRPLPKAGPGQELRRLRELTRELTLPHFPSPVADGWVAGPWDSSRCFTPRSAVVYGARRERGFE
jgi:hypothetical protein